MRRRYLLLLLLSACDFTGPDDNYSVIPAETVVQGVRGFDDLLECRFSFAASEGSYTVRWWTPRLRYSAPNTPSYALRDFLAAAPEAYELAVYQGSEQVSPVVRCKE